MKQCPSPSHEGHMALNQKFSSDTYIDILKVPVYWS